MTDKGATAPAGAAPKPSPKAPAAPKRGATSKRASVGSCSAAATTSKRASVGSSRNSVPPESSNDSNDVEPGDWVMSANPLKKSKNDKLAGVQAAIVIDVTRYGNGRPKEVVGWKQECGMGGRRRW